MSRGARLSIIGLYNWDNTIFDTMVLPEDWGEDAKAILINNIMMECGELEILYTDPTFFKFVLENWSAKENLTWQRIFNAMTLEYNPIENYNRTEESDRTNSGALTHSGTDSVQGSGSDSDVGTGNDTITNSVTSFDNNTFVDHDKSVNSKGTTITHNHGIKDTTTYGHIITDTTGQHIESHISGNIGVTTSQQMLEAELELTPKLNIINYIIESFKNRFCLLVY